MKVWIGRFRDSEPAEGRGGASSSDVEGARNFRGAMMMRVNVKECMRHLQNLTLVIQPFEGKGLNLFIFGKMAKPLCSLAF